MVELAFIIPWVAFLFVGALDAGFYSYGLISVESAARVAALYTSSSSSTAADAAGACTYVLGELQGLPNIGTSVTSCGSNPLTVTAASVTGAGGTSATLVSVTYRSMAMIPIPGILSNQFTWSRNVKLPIRQ
jgi:Flp pilus assembly protein TadG